MRVLIVEDHQALARVMEMIYRQRGHEVRHLFDWQDGQALVRSDAAHNDELRAFAPHLVLLDLEWTAVERPVSASMMLVTLARWWWPTARIVGYTARWREMDPSDVGRLDELLHKPVEVVELLRASGEMEVAVRRYSHRRPESGRATTATTRRCILSSHGDP